MKLKCELRPFLSRCNETDSLVMESANAANPRAQDRKANGRGLFEMGFDSSHWQRHPPSGSERESSGHDFREALVQTETVQIGDPAKSLWTMESNRIANTKVDGQAPEPPILSTNSSGVPIALNSTDNAALRIHG
jgi:hypothetical protein